MTTYFESFPLSAAARLGRRPEISEILAHWNDLVAAGPVTYARIAPLVETHQDDVAIYERASGDFFYLAFGKRLRAQSRVDLTGRFMTEVQAPETIQRLRKVYEGVLETGEPAYMRATYDNGESVDFYERLVLPVLWHKTGEKRVLICPTFLYKPDDEILRLMFDRSPAALIVAMTVGSGEGPPSDGWALMINRRARNILSLTGDDGRVGDRTVRAMLPCIDDALWIRIVSGAETVTSSAIVIEGRAHPMRAERVLDFLIFRIEVIGLPIART